MKMDNAKKNWDAHKTPSLDICPEEFCFMWEEKDSYFASGLYDNLNEAFAAKSPVFKSFCGNSFGKCIRDRNNQGYNDAKDWYEPCEPFLETAGLPWFYFMNPETMKKRDKIMYDKHFELEKPEIGG
ncbi:MAG: hypothetical protein LBH44_10735 [Treponema sp.]|nr:hypothetical protein [Treponema sp.]